MNKCSKSIAEKQLLFDGSCHQVLDFSVAEVVTAHLASGFKTLFISDNASSSIS